MGTTKNTSYKVHVHHTDQSEVDNVKIEQGAMLHTTDALYMGHNNENVTVYPQGGAIGLGWCRYQDTQYTGIDDSTKVILSDGVTVTLPNNGGTKTRSNSSLEFYNTTTQKLIGTNVNDVHIITVEFKASAANTNQTHLDLTVENGGVVENLEMVIPFYKGNNTTQQEHKMLQYYIDSDWLENGATIKIKAHGGTAKVWDIQYFIQRTQNAG
jgi:hypothetical protein|tara:strand:+ start:255 stop:890 length:636 start_codon:yes stop_codon:yes gene_type:complete